MDGDLHGENIQEKMVNPRSRMRGEERRALILAEAKKTFGLHLCSFATRWSYFP